MHELAFILIGSVIFTALLAVTLVFLETIANPSDRRYLYSLITQFRLRAKGDSVWTTVQYLYLRHRTVSVSALLVLIVLVLVCLYLALDRGPSKSASSAISSAIQFYDVEWSKDRMTVGEEVKVSGRFYIFPWWPTQGPCVGILRAQGSNDEFSALRSFVGGVPVGTAIRVEPGKNYEFSLIMKAEKEGDGTLAVGLDLVGGRIIGPGKSISISPVSGFPPDKGVEVVVWVALFIVIGGIISALLPEARRRLMSIGTVAEVGLALCSIAIVIVLHLTDTRNDLSTPLQAGIIGALSERLEPSRMVAVTIKNATYRTVERTTTMEIMVENGGSEAVSVDEYETAGIRFLRNTVSEEEEGYPAQLLVSQGLDVDNKSPVAPGESKTMMLKIPEALGPRTSGLLFFKGAAGSRYMVPINTNIGGSAKVSPFLLTKD